MKFRKAALAIFVVMVLVLSFGISSFADDAQTVTVSVKYNGHGGFDHTYTGITVGDTFDEPTYKIVSGYRFGGWYTNESLTNQATFPVTLTETSYTFYAKWIEVVTVTFDANGHGTAPDSVTVDKGSAVTAPSITADGYTFGGWYTDSACGTAFDFSSVDTSATAYAKWTENPTTNYTVTFNMMGHGTQVDSQTIADGGKVTAPATPTADGYTFAGWYTSTPFTTQYDFESEVHSSFTLYANWKEASTTEHVVTFWSNGNVYSTVYVADGGTVNNPGTPTRSGYTFGGWYTDTACTNEFSFSTAITADTAVYAKWTASSTKAKGIYITGNDYINVNQGSTSLLAVLIDENGQAVYESYTYKWETSSGTVNLVNPNSQTVTVVGKENGLATVWVTATNTSTGTTLTSYKTLTISNQNAKTYIDPYRGAWSYDYDYPNGYGYTFWLTNGKTVSSIKVGNTNVSYTQNGSMVTIWGSSLINFGKGTYTLEVNCSDGTRTYGQISIVSRYDKPITGDDSSTGLWAVTAALSLTAAAGAAVVLKKKSY